MSANAPASCWPRVYQPDRISSSNRPLSSEAQYSSSSQEASFKIC